MLRLGSVMISGGRNVPSPLPIRIAVRLPLRAIATTRSSIVSPLKSATSMSVASTPKVSAVSVSVGC
jgi:hypothetical protein